MCIPSPQQIIDKSIRVSVRPEFENKQMETMAKVEYIATPAEPNRLLKKSFSSDCSKIPRCKAPENLRSVAY